MFMDWPALCGMSPALEGARALSGAVSEVRAAVEPGFLTSHQGRIAEERLRRAAVSLSKAVERYVNHALSHALGHAAPLPLEIPLEWLEDRMVKTAFLRAPSGPDGCVYETGP
jgi:hypothetical protein